MCFKRNSLLCIFLIFNQPGENSITDGPLGSERGQFSSAHPVPPQLQLGTHVLREYLLNKRGAIFTNEHLLSKASTGPRESRIRGQDGRPWRCRCGERNKGGNPQELSHWEHSGRHISSPPKCRSVGMLLKCLPKPGSHFWGCPLRFGYIDSGHWVFPSQPHWVQPVKQQSGNTENKLSTPDFIGGIVEIGIGTTAVGFCSRGERLGSTTNTKWRFYSQGQAEWEGW